MEEREEGEGGDGEKDVNEGCDSLEGEGDSILHSTH